MKQVISGGVRVSYPEQAWACNPISLLCETTEGTTILPDDFTPENQYAFNALDGERETGLSTRFRFFVDEFPISPGMDRVYYQAFPNQEYMGQPETFGIAFKTAGGDYISGIYFPENGIGHNEYVDRPIPPGAATFCYTGYQAGAFTPGTIPAQGSIIFYDSDSVRADDIQLAVEVDGRRAYRDTFKGMVSFDMQGLARLLFTPSEFHKMGPGQDFELYRDMTFKLFKVEAGAESQLLEDTVQCIYGALQPGETYKMPTRIPYWPGYPFTVPFVLANVYTLLIREDSTSYDYDGAQNLEPGKYNIPVVSEADKVTMRLNLTGEVWPSVYPTTYDHTFQGVGDGTIFIELIKGCEQSGSEHVYLRWINIFGGWSYGLFKVLSKATASQDSSAKIERNWQTTEFVDNYHGGVDLALTRDSQEVYNVGMAGLDQVEFDWIAECAKSFWVDQYMGNGNWRKVAITNTTITKQAKNIQELTFSVNMPKYQNQSL